MRSPRLPDARHPWRRWTAAPVAARGSLLAALLVMMTIGSILLAVASSQWSFIVRRSREKELIFRGNQIMRGIDEFRTKNNRLPTTLEEMTKPPTPVLRQQWADPMTARYDDDGKLVEGTGEWTYLVPGGATPLRGASGASGSGPFGSSGAFGASGSGPSAPSGPSGPSSRGGFGGTPKIAPFEGVASTSDEEAIGRYADSAPGAKYLDWKFRVWGATDLQGRLELPRPPGFGGYRLPGGPPTSDTLQASNRGGNQRRGPKP